MTITEYVSKGFGTEKSFWIEPNTVEYLEMIRNRQLSLASVAFTFGVSRGYLKSIVGEIKSVEEIRKDKDNAVAKKYNAMIERSDNKPTQLDKQIRHAESNFGSLSEYEKMRLDNLIERKALLEELDIAQDKKVLKLSRLINRNKPVDYSFKIKYS